uniref:lysophosphatidic acid receptor 5-like n=1 Tax=Odobenus rosmarus divergens TaxID=9708 RepID=UPI00063CD483|nr:PREDICTED: lysophosphatidic acid receptor 5-like [Odobenus rosmarus divergens]
MGPTLQRPESAGANDGRAQVGGTTWPKRASWKLHAGPPPPRVRGQSLQAASTLAPGPELQAAAEAAQGCGQESTKAVITALGAACSLSSPAVRRVAQPSSLRPQPSQTGEAGHPRVAGAPTGSPPPVRPCALMASGNSLHGCIGDPGGHVLSWVTRVSICFILALGLPLNGLGLWVFCCRLRRWTETRIYMANLVAADFLLLLSLPGVLHTLGQEQGDQEGPLCRVLQSFYYVNTYMSMCLITAVAVDRYTALCFPLRVRAWRSPRQAAFTCLALWLLVFGAVALEASLLPSDEKFCFGRGHSRGIKTLVFSLLFFFLSLLILSFCSGQVLWHLLRKHTRAPPQEAGRILKALRVVATNLATFVLCFLPLHVALMAKLVANWTSAACPTVQSITDFVQVAARMANANCCLDAISYYFVATEFQEEVGAILRMPWPFRGWMRGAPAGDHPDLAVRGGQGAAEESNAGGAPHTALQRAAQGPRGPPQVCAPFPNPSPQPPGCRVTLTYARLTPNLYAPPLQVLRKGRSTASEYPGRMRAAGLRAAPPAGPVTRSATSFQVMEMHVLTPRQSSRARDLHSEAHLPPAHAPLHRQHTLVLVKDGQSAGCQEAICVAKADGGITARGHRSSSCPV